jgi:hypothetical protein
MFFDPTGRHLIITTETGDNYYLFAKWKKAKLLSKIKVNKHHHYLSIPTKSARDVKKYLKYGPPI